MSLHESLLLFHRLVTAPENVTRTLESLGVDRAAVAATFTGDERLEAVERLDVYADMYFFRIRDVMAEQFERTAAALGQAGFHDLVTDYLVACPPRSPSLREVGDRLGDFLAGHSAAREHPWLPDLARLEWLRLDVFDDADAAVLTMDDLRALGPEAFADLPLRAVPAHRVLAAQWDVCADPRPGPATLLVWRRDLAVLHRALAPDEAAALEALRRGCSFAEVCDLLARSILEDRVTPAAFEVLSRWVGWGLLARPP